MQINNAYENEQPVEVVLLSRNSPETGTRVFNSINKYDLNITRAAFMSGDSAIDYIPAFNISLFLTTNNKDVENAVNLGLPAGRVLETNDSMKDDGDDLIELRVAFDFDGVIVDDEAEKIYKEHGIERYHEYESDHCSEELRPGLLADFFTKLSFFQKLESKKQEEDPDYKKILKISIITARNAPAHDRAINTLNKWGVEVDKMFLLGGMDKARILETLKPHLYIDDQLVHLNTSLTKNIALVHIPFGIANEGKF